MAKRGKTPSLISAHGAVELDHSGRASPCKRCGVSLAKRDPCVRVKNTDGRGRRTYCLSCFVEVMDQTEADLTALRTAVAEADAAQ